MATPAAAREPRGLQDMIEAHRLGRALISVFVAATVAAVAIWNLQDSELRERSLPVVEPYVRATGLDQNWGVFAPDPRRATTDLVARARYADGRVVELTTPEGGPFLAAYWDFRWRKWGEWVDDADKDFLRHPAALWFAREAAKDGEDPVEVVLVSRWQPLLPPGPGAATGQWQENAFYTLTVLPPGEGE